MHFAKVFLLLALGWSLQTGLAWSHGGEDHGDASARTYEPSSAGLGNGGAGDRFEAVATPDGHGTMRLYLSDLVSNLPIAKAMVEVESSGSHPWQGKSQPTATPGVYQVGWTPPPDEAVDLTLMVAGEGGSDLILIQIPARPATATAPATSGSAIPYWQEAVAMLLAMVVIGGVLRRTRRKAVMIAASLLLAGGLAVTDAHAHGDEDHGPPGQDTPSKVTNTVSGRVVALPKASQFLLEVRTEMAASREVAETLRLVGRVIPAPAAHARIHPLVPSRIGYDPDFPPPTSGQWVKRGQTLAVLDPVMSATEKVGQRLALFKGERPEATVGREMILAPIDGQLTDVHIVPGEVVTENTVLAEIIDPSRLWVEAVIYDLSLADRVAGGTASTRQIPNRTFPLRLMGVSPKVNEENQGLHLQFLVENSQGLLKAGMPLDVYASTQSISLAVAIPRNAILEQGGLPLVWVKTGPEQFEGRPVRLGQRTAEWAAIQEGIRPGDKVVVQGHNQLNAIR